MDPQHRLLRRAKRETVRALKKAGAAVLEEEEEKPWGCVDVDLDSEDRVVVDEVMGLAGKLLGRAAPIRLGDGADPNAGQRSAPCRGTPPPRSPKRRMPPAPAPQQRSTTGRVDATRRWARGAAPFREARRVTWPLVVYFLVVLALAALILALSHVLGERHREPATDAPYEGGIVPAGPAQARFSAPFYLVAAFFVVFDLEAVFLYAWAVAGRALGWAAYVEVVIFVAVLAAGLAYLWRTGGLDLASGRPGRRPAGERAG